MPLPVGAELHHRRVWKERSEFVFVPGDTVTLGWERFAVGLNQESREELEYLFREWKWSVTRKN